MKTFESLLLFRLSRVLSVGGAPVIRLCEGTYGITRREWRVIGYLGAGQSMLSSELAASIHLDRARTSRAITSLAQKGLLQRDTVQGDLRKANVHLTAQGQSLYNQVFPQVALINAHLVQDLSEADMGALDRILKTLQARAEALQDFGLLPKAHRNRKPRVERPGGSAKHSPQGQD